MNTDQNRSGIQKENGTKTAHDLVMEHINNPDTPITDEDIQNIDTNLDDKAEQLKPKEKREADELADDIKKDDTGMTYKAEL